MIDIAIPRSIDPKIGRMGNIFLYNVDDLQTIADDNLKNRLKEVELAQQLIEAEVDEFYNWLESLIIVPAIVTIQEKFEKIRKNELARYRRKKLKHFSEEDFQIIEDLTNQIMTKTLHNPIMYLRSFDVKNDKEKKVVMDNVKIVQELFKKRAK